MHEITPIELRKPRKYAGGTHTKLIGCSKKALLEEYLRVRSGQQAGTVAALCKKHDISRTTLAKWARDKEAREQKLQQVP